MAWLMLFSLTSAFAETKVSGTISTNTTWTKAGSPYIVTGSITVKAILNIEPGVEVKFEKGTYITSPDYGYGSIIAKGTQTSPIKFTSNAASPAPGDWAGIYFGYQTKEATLEYCTVEYGGFDAGYNICASSTNAAIKNCTVQKSSKSGIYLNGSSSTIGGEGNGNIISGNGTYGIYMGGDCSPIISYNKFSGNGSFPVRTYPNAKISDNTYSDNGKQAIEITGGTVSGTVTWKNEGGISEYKALGNITVKGILTIEPGIVVKFEQGTYITSPDYGNGSIIAKGTQTSPIKFTSNAASPAPGDWAGIHFGYLTKEATLEYCTVEYGGFDAGYNICASSTNIAVKNCTVQKSSKSGIYLNGSSSTIGGEGNGNTISGNGTYGIYSEGSCSPVISHNKFSGNGSFPIRTYPNAQISSNTYSDNGKQAIELIEGTVSGTVTWKNEGGISEYKALGNITVKGILTIEPGIVVKFEQGTYITSPDYGNGSIIAKGTQTSPIKFTSNAASPAPGDWAGIHFGYLTKEAVMEYCVVEYGGFDDNPNIYISSASPVVQYSTIRYSSVSGIYVTSGNPVIKCNTIEENQYGVYIKDVYTSLPPLVNNNFLKNAKYGVYNEDTKDALNAAENWWNDAGGPDKSGDKTFGNVTKTPYLTAKSSCTPLPEKTAYQEGYEAGKAECGSGNCDEICNAKYQDGYNVGTQKCKDDPASCGISSDCEVRYQEGYQEGSQQCKDNPALCGIILSGCDINGDGKTGMDDIIYGLQILSGFRPASSCDSCECETYKNAHKCECDAVYANAHPEECSLTFKTLAGIWNFKAVDPKDSTRFVEGNWTFFSNGTFEYMGEYNKGETASSKSSGEWTLSGNSLHYSYREDWTNYSDGSSKHCWTTSWPSGLCDDGTTYTYAEATAAVEGNANAFTLTQSNGWVMTFTRK